jgi:hypothetical protein
MDHLSNLAQEQTPVLPFSSSNSGVDVSLHNATEIFQNTVQFSNSYGTVKYVFTAYTAGTNGLIYTLVSYLTANTKGGSWVAGDRPDTGQWSGESGFSDPYGWVIPGELQAGQEHFNAYSPNVNMETGNAATITSGISAQAGASVTTYGVSISGSLEYNLMYTYSIPMSEIQPLSMTNGNASFQYSNNIQATNVKPSATTYVDAASLNATGPYSVINVWDQGNFAHFWGWFNIFTHYHKLTRANSYAIKY